MTTQLKIYVAGHQGMAAASVHVMNLPKPIYDAHTQPMQSLINVGFGSDVTIAQAA